MGDGAFKRFGLGKSKKRKVVKKPRVETDAYQTACKLRGSQRWRNLRGMYLRRNPVCQDCAKVAAKEVHHIIGVAEHPELCFETENLRSLCKVCHDKRHKRRKENG